MSKNMLIGEMKQDFAISPKADLNKQLFVPSVIALAYSKEPSRATARIAG